MRNKISIDELVRQKIARGEEPHNLGAWANMERMLDGKNPYQEEDNKKRRPWLFLALALLIATTGLIGGYNYFADQDSSTVKTAQTPSSTSHNTQDAMIVNNDNLEKQAHTSGNNEQPLIANNSVNKDQTLKTIINRSQNSIKNKLAAKQTLEQNTTAENAARSNQKNSNGKIISNATENNLENNPQAETVLATTNSKGTAKIEQQKPLNAKTNAKSTSSTVTAQASTKTSALKSEAVVHRNIPPTLTENYLDTTSVTEVVQKLKQDENGKKTFVADSFQYELVQQKQRTVANPRYIQLTKAQEKDAQRKTGLVANLSTSTNKVGDVMAATKSMSSIPSPSTSNSNAESTSKSSAQSDKNVGFLSMFKRAADNINQKAINITHKRFPLYAGMFAGVNAALPNSQHNFGGFQGGFTVMTPLSRLLTLQTEARFIHKNNSGYTIKDSKQIIKNTSTLNSTHGTIYNYEIDSVSRGYNLKNFYTIQIPVILNANINKFNVYAGMHYNHGFRMNINTNDKSHPISVSDTVLSGNYVPRTSTDTKFTRDDFASRLGLGYTIGGGYNFNSKVSVDLRMSNLFWDNTKGAAKQEISDVFFRIPSFQLSIGYRFRGYQKEQ